MQNFLLCGYNKEESIACLIDREIVARTTIIWKNSPESRMPTYFIWLLVL